MTPLLLLDDGYLTIQWRERGVMLVLDVGSVSSATYSIKAEGGYYANSSHEFDLAKGLPEPVRAALAASGAETTAWVCVKTPCECGTQTQLRVDCQYYVPVSGAETTGREEAGQIASALARALSRGGGASGDFIVNIDSREQWGVRCSRIKVLDSARSKTTAPTS